MFFSRVTVFLVCLCLVMRVEAAALPVFSGKMNSAVAKVIEKTGLRRGFAANDPRYLATFSGASTVAAGVAADVAVAAATAASAPVWLSLAAGLGAAAIVGGLAYGAYKLFFEDPSAGAVSSPALFKVSSGSGSGASYTPYTPPSSQIVEPGVTFSDAGYATNSPNQYIPHGAQYKNGSWIWCGTAQGCADAWARYLAGFYPNGGAQAGACVFNSPTYAVCPIQWKQNAADPWNQDSMTVTLIENPYRAAVEFKGTVPEIVDKLDAAELAKPASPATVARIANDLWQRAAAQSGYEGIPYSPSDPVTPEDAAQAQAADPAAWPTNADLMSPVAPAAGQKPVIHPAYDPVANPTPGTTTPTQPAPGGLTDVNVVNTPTVRLDLGADPGVAAPSLDGTPTAQAVLAPVFNLMPSLKSFVVPAHSAECPVSSFEFLGETRALDAHCNVVEKVRPTLFAVMAFIWLMCGTVIVLRA